MQHRRQITSASVVTLLLLGYLVSDALWLLGDTTAVRNTTLGTSLQLAAWLLAIGSSASAGVLLSRRVTIRKIAGLVGVTAFGAAILVVTGGLLLFPAQFPRDSDWDQVLLWLSLASTFVVVVFAAIGVLSALVARRLR